VLCRIAADRRELRHRVAVCLADVEDMSCLEGDEGALLFVIVPVLGPSTFLPLLPFPRPADDRGQDHDALLAPADMPAQLLPGPEAGNVGCVGSRARYQQHIAAAVAMKPAHGPQVGFQLLALAALQGLS